MQARISQQYTQGPFNNIVTHQVRRHKQQPIFTYQGRETPQNIYYEMNPYLLQHTQHTPSEQPRRPLIAKSRNSTQSKEISDRSSHRSLKVIRINGLREAEKPKIIKQHDQFSLHSSRGNEHSLRFMERQIELQNQNLALKGEQQVLKEKIRIFEENKQQELRMLQQKISQLMRNMVDIQSKIQKGEQQWKDKISQFSYHNNYH